MYDTLLTCVLIFFPQTPSILITFYVFVLLSYLLGKGEKMPVKTGNRKWV